MGQGLRKDEHMCPTALEML